ncbi:MAG: hypothetical protein HKN26_08095, partial [Acidimicrobiales bacterium]|nr:hypothetical protein [Acidimicrobiales bacterium]
MDKASILEGAMQPRSAPTPRPSLHRVATLASLFIAIVVALAGCSSDGTIDAVSDTAPPAPAATGGRAASDAASGDDDTADTTADTATEVLGATESTTTVTAPTTTATVGSTDAIDEAGTGPTSATTTRAPIVPVGNPSPAAPASPDPAPPATTGPTTTAPAPTNPSPPPTGIIPDPSDAVIAPITVTPSADLVDGQIVTVAATGWVPRASVYLVQCVGVAEETTSIDACDIGRFISTSSTDGGTWSTTMRLRRSVDLGDAQHDCLLEPCFVGAGSIFADPLTIGRHPISFDPDAPALPRPVVTIDPPDGLRHRQPVTLQGSGFLARTYVSVSQCTVGTSACLYDGVGGRTDGQGTITIDATVSRYVSDGRDLIDCLAVACELRFSTDDLNPAPVPLAFDPTEPAPPRPTITATPSTGLGADNEITVTLVGIESYWSLSLCSVDQPSVCSYKTADAQPLGSTDPVQVAVSVHRLLVPDGAGDPIDCALEECELRLDADSYGGVVARAAVSFAADGSITLPGLTATPIANLTHGQTITVATNPIGTNLGYFTVMQCLSDGQHHCETVAELIDEDRGGGFWSDTILSTTAQVKRRVPRWNDYGDTATLIDCAVAGCELRLRAKGRLLDTVPISFDPAAPLPPDPSLAVRPSIGLADGQAVTIELDHLDGWFSLRQCPGNEPDSQFCRYFDLGPEFETEPTGSATLTARVRRILHDYQGNTVDCGVSNARCSIHLSDRFSRLVGEVPLAFDPDAPLYPEPTAEIAPVDDLVDGQEVMVSLDVIDHYAGVQQCPVGDPGDRCDFPGGPEPNPVDGPTDFAVEVYRFLLDDTDCAIEACELRVGFNPHYPPFTPVEIRQPLTFDPDAPTRPPPQFTLSQRTGLRDGDTITVTGESFRGGQAVVALCADPIPDPPSVSDPGWNCRPVATTITPVEVIDGGFMTEVVVEAQFTGSVATNCREVHCYIVVAQFDFFRLPALISEPLEFAPLVELSESPAQALERVTHLTTSRINQAPPAPGTKVAAPAAPTGPAATTPAEPVDPGP